MFDDAAIFLRCAGQEAGYIDKGDDRNRKGITEPNKARAFATGIDIQASGQHHRLVGDEAHGLAVESAKAYDNVGGKLFLNFEKILFIAHLCH